MIYEIEHGIPVPPKRHPKYPLVDLEGSRGHVHGDQTHPQPPTIYPACSQRRHASVED